MNAHQSLRRPLLGAAAMLSFPVLATAQLYQLEGDLAFDRLGASIASVGDVNGDGRPDFAIGATQDGQIFSNKEGYVRVFSGATGLPLYTFVGDVIFDEFGFAVGAAGDVNGDGRADVIVGARQHSQLFTAVGQVKVFSGATGAVLHSIPGHLDSMALGSSVAGLGDVTGDGRSDFAAGAPLANSGRGMVRVWSGASGAVLHTLVGNNVNGARFGASLSRLGDVNGDGFPDILIGSLADGVFVYSGATGAQLYRIPPPAGSPVFGVSVAAIGDVNGDGKDDFVVGASQEQVFSLGTGFAQVRSGADGALLFTVTGSELGDRFGRAVAAAGDWNGDGYPDFVVGADQQLNDGVGYVRVYSGQDGALLASFAGSTSGAGFGRAVAGLGDVNGDGSKEIGIGSPNASPPSKTFAGRALVHSGDGPACTSPTTYCATSPNSVGPGAMILFSGSNSVSADNLVLVATGCPLSQPGRFYFGPLQAQEPLGNGIRCVGGAPMVRLPALTTSPQGIAVSQFMIGNHAGLITPGSTWNFQFWYRDTAAGGAQFNLSNALRVPWCL